jgi:hypothetical protein
MTQFDAIREDWNICAMISGEVYETIFFFEKTINGIVFLSILKISLATKFLQEKSIVVFQQDGTPLEFHNETWTHSFLIARTAENIPFRGRRVHQV